MEQVRSLVGYMLIARGMYAKAYQAIVPRRLWKICPIMWDFAMNAGLLAHVVYNNPTTINITNMGNNVDIDQHYVFEMAWCMSSIVNMFVFDDCHIDILMMRDYVAALAMFVATHTWGMTFFGFALAGLLLPSNPLHHMVHALYVMNNPATKPVFVMFGVVFFESRVVLLPFWFMRITFFNMHDVVNGDVYNVANGALVVEIMIDVYMYPRQASVTKLSHIVQEVSKKHTRILVLVPPQHQECNFQYLRNVFGANVELLSPTSLAADNIYVCNPASVCGNPDISPTAIIFDHLMENTYFSSKSRPLSKFWQDATTTEIYFTVAGGNYAAYKNSQQTNNAFLKEILGIPAKGKIFDALPKAKRIVDDFAPEPINNLSIMTLSGGAESFDVQALKVFKQSMADGVKTVMIVPEIDPDLKKLANKLGVPFTRYQDNNNYAATSVYGTAGTTSKFFAMGGNSAFGLIIPLNTARGLVITEELRSSFPIRIIMAADKFNYTMYDEMCGKLLPGDYPHGVECVAAFKQIAPADLSIMKTLAPLMHKSIIDSTVAVSAAATAVAHIANMFADRAVSMDSPLASGFETESEPCDHFAMPNPDLSPVATQDGPTDDSVGMEEFFCMLDGVPDEIAYDVDMEELMDMLKMPEPLQPGVGAGDMDLDMPGWGNMDEADFMLLPAPSPFFWSFNGHSPLNFLHLRIAQPARRDKTTIVIWRIVIAPPPDPYIGDERR
eukprot:gene19573-26257_t